MLITDREALKAYSASHRVWQGIPGIAETASGRTFLSFYSGNTLETYGNYAALTVSDDGSHFSEPIAVARKTGRFRCFDPVVWVDPLNRLWFIWNVMPGEEVYAAICDEPDSDPLCFREPRLIGRGIMMNKPTVLSTGGWIFPIAVWRTDIYRDMRKSAYLPEEQEGSYVYLTEDQGDSFRRLGYANVPDRSFDEHMVLEQEDGSLRMLVRTNYGIGESYSSDGGMTWSEGRDSGIPGPSSRFFIKRLRSGRVLVIHHKDFTGRNNLTAMLSEDGGRTFPYSLLLDERDEVSYPDAIEDEKGRIYVVYDRERGCYKKNLRQAYESAREILCARFREEDILHGSLTDGESYLKRVVCKLGRLDPAEEDPYAPLYVTLDGGTTNTRLHLVQGDRIWKTVSYPVGVGQGDRKLLVATVKEGIEFLLNRYGLKEDEITCVIASGMVTSDMGLCPLPHLQAPVGLSELHDGMKEVSLPEIGRIPFVFIRGVKTNGEDPLRADMMRGEETELMGLPLPIPCTVILPGSHSKVIRIDGQGRIEDCTTALTGEMLAALSAHTILKNSVTLLREGLCENALLKGYDCCEMLGLNGALFKVRVGDVLFGATEEELYSFFLGVVLFEELRLVPEGNFVAVGGRLQLKDAICLLLEKRRGIEPIRLSDEAVDRSVAMGAVRIYTYKEN